MILQPTAWQERLAYVLLKHLPRFLIREPERVLIGYVSVLIGILMLVPYFQPESIDRALEPPLVYVWAFTFLAGGIAKLISLHTLTDVSVTAKVKLDYARSLERFGASFIFLGTLIYAIVVLYYNSWSALMTFLMFMGIAITNAIRLAVSVANGYMHKLQGAT